MKALTPQEEAVILHKATEMPFSGELLYENGRGVYSCKQCATPLYKSEDKFDGHCGWPSFDDALPGAVTRLPDTDGQRVEIVCTNCGGHLGHVFEGERFTDKDVRYCVNSISMTFTPEGGVGL